MPPPSSLPSVPIVDASRRPSDPIPPGMEPFLNKMAVPKATPPPPIQESRADTDPVRKLGPGTVEPPPPALPFPGQEDAPPAMEMPDWAGKNRVPAPTPENITEDLLKIARKGKELVADDATKPPTPPPDGSSPTPPPEEATEELKVETDQEIEASITKFKLPKELQAAYKRNKKSISKLLTEHQSVKAEKIALETKLKDIEEGRIDVPNPKLEALQKERDEAMERVRVLDYTNHPEYSEKFIKPYQQTLESAYKSLKQLKVVEEDGSNRPATEADFNEIAHLPLGDAAELANKKFGSTVGPLVINRKIRLDEIKEQADEARAGASAASKEFAARQQENFAKAQAQQRETVRKLTHEELNGKFKDLFGDKEGDTEGNGSLKRELDRFGVLFEAPESLAPEARTQLAVQMRVRAANLPRALARAQAAEKEVAELRAKIAEFSASVPSGGARTEPAGKTQPGTDPMEAAKGRLSEIARRR